MHPTRALFRCATLLPDGGSCPWTPRTLTPEPRCRFHPLLARSEAVAPVRVEESVVYYLGDPDTQLVKIGTSTALRSRIQTISVCRPRLLLLATEPGTYPLERRRHRQFKTLNQPLSNGETEWFRKAPMLMDHIGDLRRDYGIISAGRPVESWMIAPYRPA